MERKEFVERAVRIVRRAAEFNENAKRKGLLALEGDIDADKLARRDIFEYGMRLFVDGTDLETLQKILSNLVAHETDEDAKRLKRMQCEAALGVWAGENTRVLSIKLLGFMKDSEKEDVDSRLFEDEGVWV